MQHLRNAKDYQQDSLFDCFRNGIATDCLSFREHASRPEGILPFLQRPKSAMRVRWHPQHSRLDSYRLPTARGPVLLRHPRRGLGPQKLELSATTGVVTMKRPAGARLVFPSHAANA